MYKTAFLLASIMLASPLAVNSSLQADDSIFSRDSVDSIFSSDSKNGQTDAEIQKRVKDKISSGWFSKGYEQVSVQVKDGAVTLEGPVKTSDDKSKVEKEARSVEGVRSLTSNLQVQQQEPGKDNKGAAKDKNMASEYPQDTAASLEDQQLNYKVRDHISGWLWDSYKDVSLNTNGGVVEVKGEVNSLEDEQKLVNDIQDVEGVKSVKSSLRVLENK